MDHILCVFEKSVNPVLQEVVCAHIKYLAVVPMAVCHGNFARENR